jgi:magnesium transporter
MGTLTTRPLPSVTIRAFPSREVRVSITTATGQKATTRVYRAGRIEKDNFPVEDISDYIDQPDTSVWVDLLTPDAGDLQVIAEELGLHELAIADAVNGRQRPRLDRYATHQFLNMYAVRLDTATGRLTLSELAAFITPRALVTVRKDDRST